MLVVELPLETSLGCHWQSLVLKELHAEGVGYHVPKLSLNRGHGVEGDTGATALVHTVCVFFAG